MKKIFLIMLSFLIIMPIKALDAVPSNIYYLDGGLNAYLENEDFGETTEDSKIYVEYRLTKEDQIKTIDLIEITELPVKNLILPEDDEFYSDDLEIESRFVISSDEYEYSDWSEKEKIESFSYEKIPTPKISNLEANLNYKLDNEKEINDFFDKYIKLNNLKFKYIVEYKFNNSNWTTTKTKYDQNDVKLELRIKYEIGEYESQYSNNLTYEKHPEKICPFDSDICCQKLGGLSICYWIGIAFVTITLLLIFIDRKKRISREA